jgi:hypothetical protein
MLGVTLPAVSDMTLSITSPASAYPGETPFSFTGKVGDYNKDAKRTYLEASDEPYIAEVSAGNAEAEGVDKPYFESRNADGEKQIPFTVAARTQSRVDITAKMVKAMVQVKFSDAFKGYFGEGAELTLTTAAGAKFAFSYDNTGADTGIAKPIFVLAGAGKSFTIDGWAIKQRPAANVGEEHLGALLAHLLEQLDGTADLAHHLQRRCTRRRGGLLEDLRPPRIVARNRVGL